MNAKIRGDYLRFFSQYTERLPIVIPRNKTELKLRERLVELAEQMLAAQQQLRSSVSDSERHTREQRVSILDREIDTLVYELYNLDSNEINIVEGE